MYNVNSVHFFCRWNSTSNATTEEQKSDDAKNAITKYYLYLVNGVSQRVINLIESKFIGSARARGTARANEILIGPEGANQTLIEYAGVNQILLGLRESIKHP